MPEPYPNQFLSIPQSILSLKHYFRVHDQPFSRSAIYLALVGLALALFAVATAFFGFRRAATVQTKALTERLAGVRFEGGKAASDAKQPAILWKGLGLLVVLDTTGKVDSLEKAMEFTGRVRPARYLFFGTAAIESLEPAAKQDEKAKTEKIEYTDAAKLAEVRKLVEGAGGKMPAVKLVNGAAKFDPGSVVEAHPADGEFPTPTSTEVAIVVQTSALMVLVDLSGKPRDLFEACAAAAKADPEWDERIRPERVESYVLLTADGVLMTGGPKAEAVGWDFAGAANPTPASTARRIAGAVRQVRMGSLFPIGVGNFVMGTLFLFLYALAFSLAGMLANALLRANLAYGELLTMAIYAATPAALAAHLSDLLLQGRGRAEWPIIVLFAIWMAYTAMGVHRTARELSLSGAPPL